MSKLAAIRIRRTFRITERINRTLDMLGLYNKNNCVIIEDTPVNRGMLKKVDRYITWGEINEETQKELAEKRGKKEKKTENKRAKNAKTGSKQIFRLNPPRKGFERKGIKKLFSSGGTLGYRGKKINELIKKMI